MTPLMIDARVPVTFGAARVAAQFRTATAHFECTTTTSYLDFADNMPIWLPRAPVRGTFEVGLVSGFMTCGRPGSSARRWRHTFAIVGPNGLDAGCQHEDVAESIEPVERVGAVGFAFLETCLDCGANWYEPSNLDKFPDTGGLDPRLYRGLSR